MNVQRIDRAEREISAPAIEIYCAFVEAALLVRWLRPHGMGAKIHQIKPTEGGGYLMSLYHEETVPAVAGKTSEREDRSRVIFDDLSPGHQIVQRVIFNASDPSFDRAMKQMWRFIQDGQTTTVSVACENVPPGIQPEDHSVGLNSSLENLAAMVERA